jgi:hypothetical protein
MSSTLVHLHFGTGRLGLGLVAPWFQTPDSKLYLFNRAVSCANATGSTALDPARRNSLLNDQPASTGTVVHYDGFYTYDENSLEASVLEVADAIGPETSVIVTASVLKVENYRGVLQALGVLSRRKEAAPDAMGRIFLVACENTLLASEVLEHEDLQDVITPETRRHVTPVHALVDRMCVGLEEDRSGAHPTVLVRAEDYGLIKLELRPETESLVEVCGGSRVGFSRHVDAEKQIKSWQFNGTHWLIALRALETNREDESDFKLNEFIASCPETRLFARDVMREMSEGIGILLRNDPAYADFVREVDVEAYLDGTARTILQRFQATDDPITRILARFQTPTAEGFDSIQAFSKRFADRVDPPLDAYESAKGVMPPAASRGIRSLFRLISNGCFIERVRPEFRLAMAA